MIRFIKNSLFAIFILASLSSFAQTFNTAGGAIPDNSATTTCFQITVSGVGTIDGSYGLEQICLDITHTWDSDLDIYLEAPDGTIIPISSDNGSSGDNYTGTCFDMTAGTSITAGTAPFSGTYLPEGDLGLANNGQSANGVWSLCITDDAGGDSGTLNNWSITFGNNPATPPTPPTNDDPCNAIPLATTVSCTYNTGFTTYGATSSAGVPAPGCGNYAGGDVWFSATVPPSGNIQVDTDDGTMLDGDIAIYDGSCSSLNLLGCDDSQSSNGSMGLLTLTGLIPGQTIYIRIWSNGNLDAGTFGICVIDPPVPPDCNGNPAASNTCGSAPNICDLDGICGSTSSSYTADYWAQLNTAFCGSIENNSFVTFVSDGNDLSLNVFVQNCAGGASDAVQFMVFSSTGCSGPVTSLQCNSPMYQSDSPVTFTATGLAAGQTYYLMVDGYAGDVCDYSIAATSGVEIPVNAGSDLTVCPGGSATLTATGGDGTYAWSTGETTQSITVTPGSTTTYTVSSNSGNPLCTVGTTTDDVTVTVLPGVAPTITATSSISGTVGPGTGQTVNVCSGGSATLTASGGGTYSWAPTTGLNTGSGATVSATPASTTTYTVTVDDGNGCIATATITVQVDPAPVVTVNSPVICYGDNATLTAAGASSYAWSPATGLSTTSGTSVTADPTSTTSYTVTGSTPGCPDATATSTVTVLPQITPDFNVTGNFCAATNNLDFSENASGESGTATYNWSFAGATPATATGASPTGISWPNSGTYNVTLTVTDGSCSESVTLPITINPQPTVTATGTDPLCNGSADGTISASASTTGSYTWVSGQTGAGPHSVTAGTYTVNFIDGNGCPATDAVTLTDPAVLAITSTSSNASCFGTCDGTVTANNATGGTTPYSYSWDGGLGTSQTPTGVCAGTYTVTVTDAHGCTATSSETITQPTQLSISGSSVDASCNGVCDGTISTTPTGGTTPYTFSWTGGVTGQNPTSVCAGSYTVTVTDANGCTANTTITVNEPSAITLSTTDTDAFCNGVCDGTVNASASGGTGALSYSWNGGLGTGAGQTAVCAGTFTVTVTDANGCTETATATVNQPTALTVSLVGNDATCNGTCNGDATASASGGTTPYSYQWDAGGNLSNTASAASLCAGTAGVTVTDGNGCIITDNITIAEPTAITLTPSAVNSTCGNSNGSVSVVAGGGAGGFTYSWSDGTGTVGTTASVASLPAGTYTVTVTDANGCTETTTATISDTGGGTASATLDTDASCNGVCDGGATVTMTGGTSPFSYLWSNGETTASATSLCVGSASVDVTDALGCIASASITVSEPTVLTAAVTSSSNPLCNTSCDGTATITVSGGTSGYNYSWDNSASTTNTASDLCTGSHVITITDANGCITTATTTLTEPTAITASIVGTDPLCNGGSNGSADLTVSGGTSPYTYSWDDASLSSSEDISNVPAGTYTATVTDANGCIETASVTISEPTAVTLTTSGTDANCGQADGEVCATPSGGTGAYTYAWDDAGLQTTSCASNIIAGTYNVTVTDANGCIATSTATISDLAGPTTNASLVNDASGAGLCDGELTTTTSGGSTPYTYLWDDGSSQTTQNATNLCAGTYCVTVTDANGCQANSCSTVNEPNAITLTITPTDILCNGACTGEADATVSGGVPPYVYSWSHGPTAEDLTGLCAGTFSLTVIDANGVTATQTVTIAQPTAVAISSATGTDNLCNGSCDGTLTASATGGTGALTYTWDNGLGTGTNITNVCAGTYQLTVSDANGCIETSSVTINEPTPLTVTPSQTDANCGQTDGEACVTVTGGTTPYTYSWDDPSSQTTACASNVPSGSYICTINDANNCSTTETITVNDISGGVASITIDNNVSCNGVCDGAATASITGGTAPYTYLWINGNSTTTASNNGFCAGPISVTITDANGCSNTTNETITEPTLLTITTSSVDASCFGSSDGQVSVTATGGTITTDYTYSWVNQSNSFVVGNTASVSGLAAGTYCITVTDDNGCSENTCVTIAEPNDIVVTTSSVNANCGQSDGTVSVATVTGGSGLYNSEDWTDASSNPISLTNAVPAGTYTVVVTDNVGCTGTATASVSDLAGPTIAIVSENATSCNGVCDGSSEVLVSGGVSPYNMTWSPAPGSGQGTNIISGLCAGTYSLNLTDANGCSASNTITITEPAPVVNNLVSSVDATGSGTCDGSATFNAAGGDGNYTYTWYNDCAATSINGTLSGASSTGLCANTYGVVVSDGNGCADTTCVTITEPGQISSTLTGTDALCDGNCDGTITVIASGGVGGYTYEWFNSPSNTAIGQTTSTATGLCTGNYYVVVTDANSITHTSTVYTVGAPLPITGAANVISNYNGYDVSCFDSCDGSTEVTASGGTAPYSFVWTDPTAQTTQIATNLCTGPIDVTVTDANGCTQIFSTILSKPPVLGGAVTNTNASCFGVCDGTAEITGAGGVTPYTYQWDDPALSTTSTVSSLCAGTYNVTLTDLNGCTYDDAVTVTEPIQLVLSSMMNGSNCGQADGDATVTIVNGVAPFTYLWDAAAGNQTTATASNLTAGCYDVTVTDANGCSEIENVCVIDLGAPSATLLTQTDVSCNTGCDGFAQIQVTGGTPPLNYNWYDASNTSIGQTTASATGLCAGNYTGEMIDNVGCQVTVSVTISEPTALNAVISNFSDVSCFGYCDGEATALASGGTAPYTYSWNDPSNQTTATATGLCPGNYTVTVTDANGCTIDINTTIGEPLQILLNTSTVDAFCYTGTGSATVTTNNGIVPFTYLWDDASAQTTDSAINLIPGTYTVTATDADGCFVSTTAIVGNIPASTAVISGTTDVLCNGSTDGTATVSISGTGTAPYSYEWFNLSGTSFGQDSITATNLAPGDYYVEVTDVNGCVSISNSGTVGEPNQVTVNTFVDLDASCTGTSDGQATSTAAGGTFPYSYQWDDPLSQNTITAYNLSAGTYNITVTDDHNCTGTASVTIAEPAPLQLDSTVTDAHCGLPDGSACVITSGGTAPYTYSWPSGATNSCQTGLLASTYCVTVTDANSCSEVVCIQVSDLGGPSAQIIDTNMVSCFGGNDGSATVDMIGGNGFFTVQWGSAAANQTTPTASNLAAGAYSVTITDSVGCNASASIIITHPDEIVSIPSTSDANCFGSCDGSAWVQSVGGTQPYIYEWRDINNTIIGFNDSISGLCAGDYNLTLTDAHNCSQNLTYTINQPVQVSGNTTVSDVTCFGACDGTATATGTVGMSPFTYQWNAAAGNQTTATATNLCPGTYTCLITDNSGCTTTVMATITEPNVLAASINTSGDVSCFGFSDGWAQVDVTGGTPNYNYSWDNNAGSLQTASNLIAGTYTVLVTDDNGCTTTASTTINQPTQISAALTTNDVDCFGNCNGSATINASGGVGGFSYNWDDPNFTTTSTATGLCAGNYTVLITDMNGCQLSENVAISQPTAIGMSVNITSSNCSQSNGQACVNVFGGTAPYVYQWNDPLTQTSACLQNVVASSYQISILDGNGCTADSLISINDIAGPTVNLISTADVTCNGDQNGFVEMTVTGGAGSTTLIWFDDLGNQITAGNGLSVLNNLDGGCYTLQATDAANCVSSSVGCVNEPNPMNSAIFIYNDATCFTGCNGDASVSVNGGLVAGDYTYNWNDPNGQTTQQATGLCAGTYTVTVSDDNSCTTQSSITIAEPTQIAISVDNVTNTSCYGSCDGSISISASGGTPPYLYNWMPNGLTSTTINGLCAGSYTIRVTDANGCQEMLIIDVTEPTPLTVTSSTTNSTCTACNGTGSVVASGGTTPYSYDWFGIGSTPTNASNSTLCPGAFLVQVVDANGCLVTINDTIIDEPSPVIDSITFISPLCNGTNTGSATVYASGGTGAYSYQWTDPASQIAQSAVAIPDGTYCVQVTDANNCSASQCTTVTEPTPLAGVPDIDRTICYGDSTQIWASGQGGTAPYQINWTSSSLSGFGPITVSPSASTNYCFTVVDANGCITQEPECIEITVTPPLDLTVTNDLFICDGLNTDLLATGDNGNGGPYTFTWSDENGQVINGTQSGDSSTINVNPTSPVYYYVELSDGCTIPVSDSVLVSINPNPQILVISTDSTGCEPFTTQFVANTDIGTNFTFDVNCDSTAEYSGSNNTFTYQYENYGVYDVCASTTSDEGCVTSVSIPNMIEVYENPIAQFNVTPEETSILSPAIEINDNSYGGYYYSWDFGDGAVLSGPMDTTITTDSLFSGTIIDPIHFYSDTGYFDITLTLTNSNGCTSTYTQTVYIEGDYILFTPSAITPNGDGKNDVFYPKGIGIDPDNYQLFIFNRWGELIFESYNPSVGWDGTYQDKVVQIDVYVWMVRTQDHKGTPHEYIGHVTVVR